MTLSTWVTQKILKILIAAALFCILLPSFRVIPSTWMSSIISSKQSSISYHMTLHMLEKYTVGKLICDETLELIWSESLILTHNSTHYEAMTLLSHSNPSLGNVWQQWVMFSCGGAMGAANPICLVQYFFNWVMGEKLARRGDLFGVPICFLVSFF